MRGTAKPKNIKATLKRIFGYLGIYRILFFIVILCIILSTAANVAGTYFLQPIINDYIVPFIGHQNLELAGFIRILMILGIIYLVGAFSTFLYARLMVTISTGTMKRIRTDLFNHIQTLPIAYFDTHTHGEIMSRFTNDTDTLREMLSNSIPQFISSALTLIGVLTMMLVLSPLLTTLVFLIVLLMLVAIKIIGSKSAFHFKKQQAAIGEVNGYIEEMIEGQKVIKVFNHEDIAEEEFEKLNENLRGAATSANTFANIMMPVMGNISYFHYALTATLGGILTIFGRMDLGTIAAFLQYTRTFANPVAQVSQQVNAVLMALAGAERIFALIDEEPEMDDGFISLVTAEKDSDGTLRETDHYTGCWAWQVPNLDGTSHLIELKGDVRLEDVTFSYDNKKTVLQNVSLYAKPGQKIAFVGSTGAGKTTITNLINRFYDIQSGTITYDGIPIKDLQKHDLRKSLSMVLQDTHLFTGTVRENIRYGNLHASDEEVVAAAKLANADYFIRHLPAGYDTVLSGDGGNLSQGQRQLLAIARAAVANPPVLILDEATSSIDTRTEALIERGMDKLMAGRTVFVIAHRLSTVRNANAIMVIEHGEIIERGDHQDLIDLQGRYYQLYTGMFELA